LENGIYKLVTTTLFSAKTGWEKLKSSDIKGFGVYFAFLLPLLALASLAWFVGKKPENDDISFFTIHAILQFISNSLGIIICSWIVSLMRKRFSTGLQFSSALVLVSVSWIPIALGNLLWGISGGVNAFHVLGLYSIYLLWQGTEVLTQMPAEKKTGFVFLVLIFGFGSAFVVNRIMLQIVTASKLLQA
jgi:hypothetical protein